MTSERADLYVAFDIEADGPIPGLFSMLSMGLCVAGSFDGVTYRHEAQRDGHGATLYVELKPISREFDPIALAVSGLDREKLQRDALDPSAAIATVIAWLREVSRGFNPVLVAYPTGFDWPFLAYYFHAYSTDPPVTFTRVCDLRTMIVTKARKPFYAPTAECLPRHIRLPPHTHHALQDAIDQAQLFSAVFAWNGA